MSYPQRSRAVTDNTEAAPTMPREPVVGMPQVPSVVGPQGGAPQLTAQQRSMAQPWKGTSTSTLPNMLPSSPWSLKDIGENYKPLVDRIKESLQAKLANTPIEQRNTKFWQGFQQYPEQMAQMVVRRVLTNQINNHVQRGPIGEWMTWLEQGWR